MPHAIRMTPRTRLQLMDILDYLNKRNPVAGERLTNRFEAAFHQLSEFPSSGPRASIGDTRRLIVEPYILTYRVRGETVEVIDIRRGRQRPPAAPDA